MFPKFTIAVGAMSLRCLIRVSSLLASLGILSFAGCAEFEGKPKEELPKVKVALPLVRDVNDFEYFIGRTEAVPPVPHTLDVLRRWPAFAF